MPYVVGALGSRPASSKGFGRNQRGGPAAREPKGTRHAVDVDSRRPACGTPQTLRVFDDLEWAPEGEWCPECEAIVPFE
jgi:hypothetical protein